MELTDYLAILGLFVGVLYLALAVVAFNRSRQRRNETDADAAAGRIVLNLEEGAVDGEMTSARMRRMAASCAQIGEKIFSERLDFSVESIGRLERMIMVGWGEDGAEANPEVVESFGAYIGEVLVRRSKGRWVSSVNDGEPGMILFLPREEGEEAITVSPFLLIREKLDNMYRYDLSIAYTALEQKIRELRTA